MDSFFFYPQVIQEQNPRGLRGPTCSSRERTTAAGEVGLPLTLCSFLPAEVADGLCCILTTPCLTQHTSNHEVRSPEAPVVMRSKNFTWRDKQRYVLIKAKLHSWKVRSVQDKEAWLSPALEPQFCNRDALCSFSCFANVLECHTLYKLVWIAYFISALPKLL